MIFQPPEYFLKKNKSLGHTSPHSDLISNLGAVLRMLPLSVLKIMKMRDRGENSISSPHHSHGMGLSDNFQHFISGDLLIHSAFI